MNVLTDNQPYDLKQTVAHHGMREHLQKDYPSRWVVIHNCELAGDYETYDAARSAAREKGLDLLDCLIQQVGVEPPIIVSLWSRYASRHCRITRSVNRLRVLPLAEDRIGSSLPRQSKSPADCRPQNQFVNTL